MLSLLWHCPITIPGRYSGAAGLQEHWWHQILKASEATWGNKHGGLTGKIGDLTSKIGDFTGKICDLTGKIGAFAGKMDDLTGKIGDLTDKICDF